MSFQVFATSEMREDSTEMLETNHQKFCRTDSAGCGLQSTGMHPSKGERGKQHEQSSLQLSFS